MSANAIKTCQTLRDIHCLLCSGCRPEPPGIDSAGGWFLPSPSTGPFRVSGNQSVNPPLVHGSVPRIRTGRAELSVPASVPGQRPGCSLRPVVGCVDPPGHWGRTEAGTESTALPVRNRYAGHRFEEALPRVGGPEQRGPGCLYPEPHPTVHGTG